MFSLAMVTTIGKLLFLPSQHDIWPQRESINTMLAETPFSGSDTELALSKHVLMEGRKERLNEASLFSEISSPPEPSPPALSLVLTPQGRLLGPTHSGNSQERLHQELSCFVRSWEATLSPRRIIQAAGTQTPPGSQTGWSCKPLSLGEL